MVFFCQAEDGIRDLVRSRGLGDVYKRQVLGNQLLGAEQHRAFDRGAVGDRPRKPGGVAQIRQGAVRGRHVEPLGADV